MTTKEVDMFARRVSMLLKPNSLAEFTNRLEKQIIPLLRKQTGFQHEITFVAPGETKAFGISLWNNKENAETYNRATYPEVTKILAGGGWRNSPLQNHTSSHSPLPH